MSIDFTTGFLEVHVNDKTWEDTISLHDDDGMTLCLHHSTNRFAGKHVKITIEELPEPEGIAHYGYTEERKKMQAKAGARQLVIDEFNKRHELRDARLFGKPLPPEMIA